MPRKTQARAYGLGLLLLALGMVAPGLPAADAPAASTTTPDYDYRNPPQGVFDEQWMEIFISGQKVGYSHQVYRRAGDHVFTDSHEEFRIKRLNFTLSAVTDSTTEETLEGVPLAFHSSSDMSDQVTTVDGKGDGKTFTITKTVGAFHDTQKATFPDGTLMSWGQERLSRIKGLTPGLTYTFSGYDPSDDAFSALTMQFSVGQVEKTMIKDRAVELSKVDLRVVSKSGEGAADMTAWVDAGLHVRKMTVDLAGMSMEMLASTEASAKGAFLPQDIFAASLLTLPRDLPPGTQSVTLELRRADGQPLPLPPESSTEHSVRLPDGGVAMTLRRTPRLEQNTGPLGAGLPSIAPYLARNSYMDTRDQLLRRLADQAGGPPDTGPVAVAWQLRDFVADYINQKDLSVGFATATQAAVTREGDCTEHAVLLAALGRIRGLPTRTVSGLAYLPVYEGQKNILGFHMWTQFYFNGQWVDFDSALTDGPEPYWRLGLVASDLNEVSLSDFSLELMRWMAQLKITVTSLTPSPKN